MSRKLLLTIVAAVVVAVTGSAAPASAGDEQECINGAADGVLVLRTNSNICWR